VDPGIGFGKGSDPEVNLGLLRHAGDIGRAVGAPVVVGPSRKRFLRRIAGSSHVADRDPRALDPRALDPRALDPQALDPLALDAASIAACLAAVREGAQVLRVHNVALLQAALAVYTRI
jgi:dihydropteroate synthase